MIRWLTALLTGAAVLWGGWWLFGSAAVLRGVQEGAEALRAEGWIIAYDDLSVAGFPNRFDTTVDAPRLATPDGAFEWSAPFFQVFALSYKPHHLIAVAPQEMTFATPAGRFVVTSGDLRASIVGSGPLTPVLERSTLTGEGIAIVVGDLGATLATAQVATRQSGSEEVHDVALSLSGLTLSPGLRALADAARVLPATIGTISADAQVTLTGAVGAGQVPQLAATEVRGATLAWGDVRLDVSGRIDVLADGTPEGRMTLRAEGWQQVLRLAVGLGLMDGARLPLLAAGLGGMADADGAVTVDLVLSDGQMSLASIPLGPAPRL